MEQVGTSYKGSTTYTNLFKSSLGPTDVIAAVLKGNAAVTYNMGSALIDDPANAGCKKKYTNGDARVSGEAVANGDGSTVAFDLDNANVVPGTLVCTVNGVIAMCRLSSGTGTSGVDQVIFNAAPGNGLAIVANYVVKPAGACILMTNQATTVGGPNVTADGCRDGSVDTTLIKDSAGALVDADFKAALPKVVFD